jgi:hypothetical protein
VMRGMQDDDRATATASIRAAKARAGECDRTPCKAHGSCQLPRSCKVSCHAGRDGECNWDRKLCPQYRDREPETTGRHCPRDLHDDQPEWDM